MQTLEFYNKNGCKRIWLLTSNNTLKLIAENVSYFSSNIYFPNYFNQNKKYILIDGGPDLYANQILDLFDKKLKIIDLYGYTDSKDQDLCVVCNVIII